MIKDTSSVDNAFVIQIAGVGIVNVTRRAMTNTIQIAAGRIM